MENTCLCCPNYSTGVPFCLTSWPKHSEETLIIVVPAYTPEKEKLRSDSHAANISSGKLGMATTSVGHKPLAPYYLCCPSCSSEESVLFIGLWKGHSMKRVWQIGRFRQQLLAYGWPEFVSRVQSLAGCAHQSLPPFLISCWPGQTGTPTSAATKAAVVYSVLYYWATLQNLAPFIRFSSPHLKASLILSTMILGWRQSNLMGELHINTWTSADKKLLQRGLRVAVWKDAEQEWSESGAKQGLGLW